MTRGTLLKWIKSGRLGLDLMDIARCRRAVDGDAPRLHGLGDFPYQIDLEQAVFEGDALHMDVGGEVELTFEMAGRDPPIKEPALGLIGLATFDGDDVL